jgi:hypothetical protein
MTEDAFRATGRLQDLVEDLLTKADFHHEIKLAQATRLRLETTLRLLAGKASHLKMLPAHLSHINRVYIQKLRLALNSILDLIRWIWEDEVISKKEIAEVKDGIARVVQGAMDVIWHFEDLDQREKIDECGDYQNASDSLDELLAYLLHSIDSVARDEFVPISPKHKGFITPPPDRKRTVTSLALTRPRLPPTPVMEVMKRIDKGDLRLIRPSMQPLRTGSRKSSRSRTPADGIPSTLLWNKTPVESNSPKTMERALSKSREVVDELGVVVREPVHVRRIFEQRTG